MKRHAAPIIAAVLLLLPVLYVGSYLALVVPGKGPVIGFLVRSNYRFPIVKPIFWPLEQIDRKLRTSAWENEHYRP